jgi:tripartite-type tricarboxylate transporter receptor subunit TctC
VVLRRTAICLIAIGVSAMASIGGASALDYPTRPVRWVVGFAPGGANDILARLIGQRLSQRLGQQFVIENRPGAGGNIGAESVINSEAEKYPKPSRIVMARYLGQLELFPLERPKPAAYQLQLPLSGGYWWGLLARPEVVEKREWP